MVRWMERTVDRMIRVVIANRPRLIRELIVSTIADQPDIEIVAEIQDESEIPRIVEQTAPEFLIITLDSPDQRPLLCDSLLRQHPEMKIMALAAEGNCTMFYSASLRIHSTILETSEMGILSALRSGPRTTGG